MDESDLKEGDASWPVLQRRRTPYRLIAPVAVWLVAVAVVSGLVFGGIIRGDESRSAPEEVPTTQSTVLIVP